MHFKLEGRARACFCLILCLVKVVSKTPGDREREREKGKLTYHPVKVPAPLTYLCLEYAPSHSRFLPSRVMYEGWSSLAKMKLSLLRALVSEDHVHPGILFAEPIAPLFKVVSRTYQI